MQASSRLHPRLLPLAALALSWLLSACGAGTAAVVSGSDEGGGGSTPALTIEVECPKVSPTRLLLDATQPVQVALFYDKGAGKQELLGLSGTGVSGNLVSLPADDLTWDFASDLGGTSFMQGVKLLAEFPGGGAINGGELTIGLGNDPPVVESVEPMPTDPQDPSESSGNVEVRVEISDTSVDPFDTVQITVEWRRTTDAPDAWQPATAAGVLPGGIEVTPEGVTLSYFWNTNVDLADGDDDVVLQVTADDGSGDPECNPVNEGLPRSSDPFHIDNNEEPIVQLFTELVLSNPDERRGIPVPFKVFDEESDLVEVILQWRRPDEDFPGLPGDPAALDALLADPVQRAAHHVCTPVSVRAVRQMGR
jgi:hypothetical protein